MAHYAGSLKKIDFNMAQNKLTLAMQASGYAQLSIWAAEYGQNLIDVARAPSSELTEIALTLAKIRRIFDVPEFVTTNELPDFLRKLWWEAAGIDGPTAQRLNGEMRAGTYHPGDDA
jgi:hypothetical protein